METKTVLALRDAGVDTEGALRRFAGRSDLYEKFLFKFPNDESFNAVAPALQAEDWEAALRAAHTLKGVSANLGMNRLAAACAEMVNHLRGGRHTEAAASYGELKAAYEEICAILAGVTAR